METIWKRKQTNKQTNKQVGAAHVEVQMHAGGSAELCSMQSTWKSFGDALEMHWKSTEFDMQGCTLLPDHQTVTCYIIPRYHGMQLMFPCYDFPHAQGLQSACTDRS